MQFNNFRKLEIRKSQKNSTYYILPVRDCEYIFTILSNFLMTAAVTNPDIAPN